MPSYLSPGVHAEEVAGGSRPIEGVGTSVAAFVGPAPTGPLNEPTLVTNRTQYAAAFGRLHRRVLPRARPLTPRTCSTTATTNRLYHILLALRAHDRRISDRLPTTQLGQSEPTPAAANPPTGPRDKDSEVRGPVAELPEQQSSAPPFGDSPGTPEIVGPDGIVLTPPGKSPRSSNST